MGRHNGARCPAFTNRGDLRCFYSSCGQNDWINSKCFVGFWFSGFFFEEGLIFCYPFSKNGNKVWESPYRIYHLFQFECVLVYKNKILRIFLSFLFQIFEKRLYMNTVWSIHTNFWKIWSSIWYYVDEMVTAVLFVLATDCTKIQKPIHFYWPISMFTCFILFIFFF